MVTEAELAVMRRAIALSAFGLGTTSPNPPVGCVVLDRIGEVVGEGFHERKGELHAEGRALAMAGARAPGGTAVVTLEPCNHEGRAPACRRLLLEAGISRCLIAVLDPTSREEGGAQRLRAKEGIPESHGRGMLGLQSVDTEMPPQELMADLYAAGVRSLLLNTDARTAEPYVAAGVVDRVDAFLRHLQMGTLPVGLRLVEVDKLDGDTVWLRGVFA